MFCVHGCNQKVSLLDVCDVKWCLFILAGQGTFFCARQANSSKEFETEKEGQEKRYQLDRMCKQPNSPRLETVSWLHTKNQNWCWPYCCLFARISPLRSFLSLFSLRSTGLFTSVFSCLSTLFALLSIFSCL